GNSGATLRSDFIELFNSGSSAVVVDGWSVQYASAAGTSWQVTPLSGMIPAGGYFLVQEADGANVTTTRLGPAPDATGSIAMSATAGKVALVNNNTALSGTPSVGSCPTINTGAIVDFLGYGSATCFRGAGGSLSATGTPGATSNTEAAVRKNNGCTLA